MADTTISWTNATWNPVAGCKWSSPGCDNCYAKTMTRRLEAMGQADYAGLTTRKHFNGIFRPLPHKLGIPLKWRKPRMVFVNSMSDLFGSGVPDEFIDRVFAAMSLCRQHTFQILTKRAERMRSYMESRAKSSRYWEAACPAGYAMRWEYEGVSHSLTPFPLPNVWLGVSVEDQTRAEMRIPHLIETPAAVRFLSCEPLLGPLDFRQEWVRDFDGTNYDGVFDDRMLTIEPDVRWVIVGCESGRGRRPMDQDWARSIRDQCREAGISFFMKQMEVDGKVTEDIDQFPEDLRIRQFPGVNP